ncbi:MAG: hypothetical protein PF505_00145 [Vallitaleaceae bacterium]|nr:hypothetical protein [Vallitaleaceae bacterium]
MAYFTWRIIDEEQAGAGADADADKKRRDDKRTFYICEDFACLAPVHELPET